MDAEPGGKVTIDDAAWVFTGVVFTVITVCVVWTMKEERKKK
jgi:hypothetical protein